MSDFITHPARPIETIAGRSGARAAGGALPLASQYLVALAMVAGASLLAFVVKNVISAPNLTLIYVLPVVVAGMAFGWGPSLFAVVASVLAFDFFFTEPYFSLAIARPADIWAAVLLLVIAGMVTTVAAESRRRAVEARRAAERAEAIQALANLVIQLRPRAEVFQAAATALNEIFLAPAVIFLQETGAFRRVASAGRPELSPADEEAARGAFSAGLHTRAETYPYDGAEFEFWPVGAPSARQGVIGLDFTGAQGERPERPERFVDVVAAYLTIALERCD